MELLLWLHSLYTSHRQPTHSDSQVLDECSFKGMFILYASLYMTFWKRQNYRHNKRSVVARACGGMGVRGMNRKSAEGF